MRCFLLCYSTLALAVPGMASAQAISGDYIEGRSNHVFGCYCEWSGESQTGGLEAIVAFHFRGGFHRNAPVAGLRVAAVIVGETTLSQGNPPRKSVVVLDSTAPEARRKLAEALLRERFGKLIGQVIEVRSVPLQLDVSSGAANLKAGNLLNLALRRAVLPDDALQGAVLWYDPFVPLVESHLAVTVNTSYGGREFDTTWNRSEPGVTGYFGRFEIKVE